MSVANHDEALQLAYLNRDQSNLARCYIDLHGRLEAPDRQRSESEALHREEVAGLRRVCDAVEVQAEENFQKWQAAEDALGEARELLKDVHWRIADTRETLMREGIGGTRLYGCDEWSTPTVNLQLAVDRIDSYLARTEVPRATGATNNKEPT